MNPDAGRFVPGRRFLLSDASPIGRIILLRNEFASDLASFARDS